MNKLLEVWHFQVLYYHCQAVLAQNVLFKKYEWSSYTDVSHTPNFLWKANLLNDTSSPIKTFTISFSKSHDSREQNWWTTAVLMAIGNSKALSSMTLGLRTYQTMDNFLAFFWGCSLHLSSVLTLAECWLVSPSQLTWVIVLCQVTHAFHPHVK